MEAEKKLVGVEVVAPAVKLEGQDVLGSVGLQHVGKIGWVKLKLEGAISAKPLLFKAIDKVEEWIPGDQKIIAAGAKAAIEKYFS